MLIPLKRLGHSFGIAAFNRIIQLRAQRLSKLADHIAKLIPRSPFKAVLGHPRQLLEDLEIGFDSLSDVRPLNLHSYRPAIRQLGEMDLAD